MRRSRRQINRRTVLTTIAVISVVGLCLPTELTSRALNFVQVLIPFQDVANRSVRSAATRLGLHGDDGSSTDAVSVLQRENELLRNQLASMAGRLHDLSGQAASLARIRRQQLNEGSLIAARVVATDALNWRKSRLIDAGALSGVRENAAVASHHFTAHLEDPTLVRDGMSVLAGEVLVGFVDGVGTHAARVKLLNDPGTDLPVLLARQMEDGYHPLDNEFWLTGDGKPRLLIRDVHHRYVTEQAVMVGDIVLTTAQDIRLPASLVIGTVSEIQTDPDNPLLAQLWVTPAIDPRDLRTVFVVDPDGQPAS